MALGPSAAIEKSRILLRYLSIVFQTPYRTFRQVNGLASISYSETIDLDLTRKFRHKRCADSMKNSFTHPVYLQFVYTFLVC